MKSHTFKLRSVRRGPQHVLTVVFAGYVEPGGTLANCGSIVMNVGEWQAFGALLLLGAKAAQGRITVVMEGDEKVVAQEGEPG